MDIKNGTIGLVDLSKTLSAKLAAAGTSGPAGPAGPAGPTGPVGAAGSPGPAGPGLGDGEVTTAKLANDAVTSAKVAPDSLLAADLALNSVGAPEIASNGVGNAELATGAVHADEVLDGSLVVDDYAKTEGFFPIDYFELDPGECLLAGFSAGVSVTGEVILATPDSNWPSGLTYTVRPAGTHEHRHRRLQRLLGRDRSAVDELELHRPQRLSRGSAAGDRPGRSSWTACRPPSRPPTSSITSSCSARRCAGRGRRRSSAR